MAYSGKTISFGTLHSILLLAAISSSCAQDPAKEKKVDLRSASTSTVASGDASGDTTNKVLRIEVSPVDVVMSQAGNSQHLTATVVFENQSNADFTAKVVWSSESPEIATIGNESPTKGLVQAKKPGVTKISAEFGGVSGSVSVSVSKAKLTELVVSPVAANFPASTSQKMEAMGSFSDGSAQTMTDLVAWTSSFPAIAIFSDPTPGLLKGVSPGTSEISASLDGVVGRVSIEVKAPLLEEVVVEAVSPNLIVQTTARLKLKAKYADGSIADATEDAVWASSNPAVASVSNEASNKGAVRALAVGSADISSIFGGKSAKFTITVRAANLLSMALAPASATLQAGRTLQFSAVGTFDNATTQEITNDVTWSSSRTDFASISNVNGSRGMVTGRSAGDSVIGAALMGRTAQATLRVTPIPQFGLSVLLVGMGTVASTPAGINCGATCIVNFDAGTLVTLTAAPASGFSFAGWSGGGCTGKATCATTINAATTVTATFSQIVYPLTVSKTGTGTITSNTGGINCGLTCTANINAGTPVTLTATPAAGFVLTGWTGGGCSGISTCVTTVNAATTVTAAFAPISYVLTVTKTGTGTVTSNVGGINCGTACTATANAGTAVTLTATPAAGFTFLRWTGGGCTSTSTCTTTVNAATSIAATFEPITYALTVNKTGTGTVASNVGGINCGATCSANVNSGTPVTLTATPSAGFRLTGWSGGGCSGTSTCVTTVNAATTVSVTFAPITYSLTVTKGGTGTGTVTSNAGGINCGTTCASNFNAGTTVTLSAVPAGGFSFSGWTGAGCSGTGTCVTTVNAATTVTASFNTSTYALTVTKTGNGTIISDVGGINCGAACSSNVSPGVVVELTAMPAAGFYFSGWAGGGCTGDDETCSVTVAAATTVSGSFKTYTALAPVVGRPIVSTTVSSENYFGKAAFIGSISDSGILSNRANTYNHVTSITVNGANVTLELGRAFASRIRFFIGNEEAPAQTTPGWLKPPQRGLDASFLILKVVLSRTQYPGVDLLKVGDLVGLFAKFDAQTSYQSTATAMNSGLPIIPLQITDVVIPAGPNYALMPLTSGQPLEQTVAEGCVIRVNHCQSNSTILGAAKQVTLNLNQVECVEASSKLFYQCATSNSLPIQLQMGFYLGNSLNQQETRMYPYSGSNYFSKGTVTNAYIDKMTGNRFYETGTNRETVDKVHRDLRQYVSRVGLLASPVLDEAWATMQVNRLMATRGSTLDAEGRVETVRLMVSDIKTNLNLLVGSTSNFSRIKNLVDNYSGLNSNSDVVGQAFIAMTNRPENFNNIAMEILSTQKLYDNRNSPPRAECALEATGLGYDGRSDTASNRLIKVGATSTLTVRHLINNRLPTTVDGPVINGYTVSAGTADSFQRFTANVRAVLPKTNTASCSVTVVTVNSFVWVDPVTTKSWHFAGFGEYSSCPAQTRLPSQQELNQSIDNGLVNMTVNTNYGKYIIINLMAEGDVYRQKFASSINRYIPIAYSNGEYSRVCIGL